MAELTRAVVYDGSDYTFESDVTFEPPGPTEVLVRIAAAGLCHSDLSVINGTIPFPTPVVLGHEGAGIVERVGGAVTSVQEGDHVVLTTVANCGTCPACSRGRPTMCRARFGLPTTPFRWRDRPTYSFANTSVFAERTVVSAVQCVKIPADVPLTSAALVGCGVLTGIGAVQHRAKVRPGTTVAVIGVGGIGLNVIQGARLAGAARIIAIDTNPRKEAIARDFGATHFLDPTGSDAVTAVRTVARTGVDYAFECVGHPALIRAAIDMLDSAGTCVMLGVPAADAEVSFNVASMYLDKGVLGCRYGSSQPHADIPTYIDLYRDGRLKLDELVTRTYPITDIRKAVHDLEAGELARGVLTLTD